MDLQIKKISERYGISTSRAIRLGRATLALGFEKLNTEKGKTITLLFQFFNEKTGQEIRVSSIGVQAIRYGDRLRLGYIKRRQVLQKV